MTTTPESWDDVGCLRLQVDCISQQVQGVRLDVSQLQKLSEQVAIIQAQEQKKERCQMKVCMIATAFLSGCVLALLGGVLALHIFTMYGGSTPRLTQRLSDRPWTAHLDDVKSSEVALDTLMLATPTEHVTPRHITSEQQPLKQKPVNDVVARLLQAAKELLAEQHHLAEENADERTDKNASRLHYQWEEVLTAAKEKSNTSWRSVEKKEMGPKEPPKLDVQSAEQSQSTRSIDSEGRSQKVAKSIGEDPKGVREDDRVMKDKDSKKEKSHSNGKRPREEPAKDSFGLSSFTVGRFFSDFAWFDSELLGYGNPEASKNLLKQAHHGVFWVCFPPSALEQNVKKYTPVFNKVSRSWKWRMYPFVYLNTRTLGIYQTHFCDDVEKITFVVEKRSNDLSDSNQASSQRSGLPTAFSSESPVWFKREFRADHVVQPTLIEEFLNDVHSGKLPGIRPTKGDL